MKTIQSAAVAVIEAAGSAGGIDEVRRVAELGWPDHRELDDDSPELRAAIRAEARRVLSAMTTTYSVQMIDSETPAAWMSLPGVVAVRPGAQDSGRVNYKVETSDAEVLETALEADESVVEYSLA